MKKLPKTIAGREIRRHRLLLARWLHELRIDCLLRADEQADPAAFTDVFPAAAADQQISVNAGDVILLPPATAEQNARPLYVLVLKYCSEAGDGMWLIVPFSRFSVPAVRGEWKTGLRAKPLRVLCVWNVGKVSASELSTGWPVSVVNTVVLKRALQVYEHLRTGGCLDAVVEQGLGPPLKHPLDPRHKYLEEEADLLAAHNSFIEAENLAKQFPYQQKSGPQMLAAEDRVRYGKGGRKKRGRKKA